MKLLSIKLIATTSLICLAFMPLAGQIRFEDITEKAGLIEPLKGMMGHCAAWGDVNGDGFPDLFFGTFSDRPDTTYNKRGHTGGPETDKLFISQGNGTFKEVMISPLRVMGRCSGAAFADFDNDGDLDLIVSHQSYERDNHAKPNNFLFANDGKGNLTDVTEKAGLNFGWPFLGRSTFVFDYDGDGLLDLLMQEDWVRADVSGGNSRLMKNTGNLKFVDVTEKAGFPHGFRQGLYGLGGFVSDLNGDNWPDVFFAHTCRMFINNRNGTFHEKKYKMIDEKYTEPATTNPDWTCGADIGDLDNDGDMDLVMGDHFVETNTHRLYVFLNEGNDVNGDPILRDITSEANVVNPDGKAIHVQIQDIDNDGRMDILTSRCNCIVYRNAGIVNGIPRFENPVNSGYKGGIGYWAGGPFCDYDRDGRLDFFGPEWEPGVASPLLRNVTAGAENYLDIELELEKSLNRNGIGARVEIFKAGRLGKKDGLLGTSIISVSNGYASGYEAIAHFGVPNNKTVDIRVTMPCNGSVYKKTSVTRNQLFILKK
jgi:enediyne biosynthesis protein E4